MFKLNSIQTFYREVTLDCLIWLHKYKPIKAKKLTRIEWAKFFIIIISMNIGYLFYSQYYELKLNVMSKSLPGDIYLLEKNTLPLKNDLVIVQLPKNNRFFSGKSLLKLVKGVSGDKVEVKNRQLFINSKNLGQIKSKLKNGTSVFQISDGVIPKHHYFIWSPHKDSYDSRYKSVGLISESQLLGKAYEIF